MVLEDTKALNIKVCHLEIHLVNGIVNVFQERCMRFKDICAGRLDNNILDLIKAFRQM